MAPTAHRRYAEILRDVEELINDHIRQQKKFVSQPSKLKLLVPSVGIFFTPLLLEEAFIYQDNRRRISSRRFVPPSFNDIRLTLNSAQVMSLVRDGPLQLVTFDGDVTLYDDGQSLTEDNPVIPRILTLLSQGIRVGIVTAAGYSQASKYYFRLYGLLEAIKSAAERNEINVPSLIVLGGESNYLFTFDTTSKYLLTYVPRTDWMLEEMKAWTEPNVSALLDVAEAALRECITNMQLPAEILRKERAVGIIPKSGTDARKFTREQLEETVLVTQQVVEMSPVGKKIPFCAFNGGNDVFVDIGDKSWGVLSCQKYLGGIEGSKTLHIGDQFLSAGANDFKARLACTTAWIASPAETVELLDELADHIHSKERRTF
ncbi:IMP 5'-nucleotidase [Peltigera leucophlebia]|nr:IMP 5'-nucleotidase [Peltigera leucophlebia]